MMSSQWGMSHVKNVTRSMRKERPSEMMTSLFVRSYAELHVLIPMNYHSVPRQS